MTDPTKKFSLRTYLVAMRDGVDNGEIFCDPLEVSGDHRYMVDSALEQFDRFRPYMHHLDSCNLSAAKQKLWDEAQDALTNVPPEAEPQCPEELEAVSIAQAEIDEKRKKCDCGLEELLA